MELQRKRKQEKKNKTETGFSNIHFCEFVYCKDNLCDVKRSPSFQCMPCTSIIQKNNAFVVFKWHIKYKANRSESMFIFNINRKYYTNIVLFLGELVRKSV